MTSSDVPAIAHVSHRSSVLFWFTCTHDFEVQPTLQPWTLNSSLSVCITCPRNQSWYFCLVDSNTCPQIWGLRATLYEFCIEILWLWTTCWYRYNFAVCVVSCTLDFGATPTLQPWTLNSWPRVCISCSAKSVLIFYRGSCLDIDPCPQLCGLRATLYQFCIEIR